MSLQVFEDLYQRVKFLSEYPKSRNEVITFNYEEAIRKFQADSKDRKEAAKFYANKIQQLLEKIYHQKEKVFKKIFEKLEQGITADEPLPENITELLPIEIPGLRYYAEYVEATDNDRSRWYKDLTVELFSYQELINTIIDTPYDRVTISRPHAQLLYEFDISSSERDAPDESIFAHSPANYEAVMAVLTRKDLTSEDISKYRIRFGGNQEKVAFALQQLHTDHCFPYSFIDMEKMGCFYGKRGARLVTSNWNSFLSKWTKLGDPKVSGDIICRIDELVKQLKQ